MTRVELFLSEIEKLRTPQNTKRIDALIEGVSCIADEARRRQAKRKALAEAEGFKKLDAHRLSSGLTDKAFLEGVGHSIIGASLPDETKSQMLDVLGRYGDYLNTNNT